MNNIKSKILPYTFSFKNCVPILERSFIFSIFYYIVMVFILSYFYHFNLVSYLGLINSILVFLKHFSTELFLSSCFYLICIYFIYIINNSKINNDKLDINLKNIFNLFIHLYTIPFIIDLSFLLFLNDVNFINSYQSAYAFFSILVSFFINIVYPYFFFKYMAKNSIKINRFKENKTFKSKSYGKLVEFLKCAKDTLLFNYEHYVHKVCKSKIYISIVSTMIILFIVSYFKLILSPYVLNMEFNFFTSHSMSEIITSYVDYIKGYFIFISSLSLIYYFTLKIKLNSKVYIVDIFKVILNCSYLPLLLSIIMYLDIKVRTLSLIKPKLLPTQMIQIYTTPLFYIIFIIIFIFTIRNILYKLYSCNTEFHLKKQTKKIR